MKLYRVKSVVDSARRQQEQTLGQGYGAVKDFPFPAGDGTMESALTGCAPTGILCPKDGGMTAPPNLWTHCPANGRREITT